MSWLKLFGPVLFYDMIRAARRGRYFLLRFLYALLLLYILFSVSCGTLGQGGTSTLHSVQFKRPRDASAVTYLFIFTYLVLATTGYIIDKNIGFGLFNFPLWFGANAPRVSDFVKVVNSGNVVALIAEVAE